MNEKFSKERRWKSPRGKKTSFNFTRRVINPTFLSEALYLAHSVAVHQTPISLINWILSFSFFSPQTSQFSTEPSIASAIKNSKNRNKNKQQIRKHFRVKKRRKNARKKMWKFHFDVAVKIDFHLLTISKRTQRKAVHIKFIRRNFIDFEARKRR